MAQEIIKGPVDDNSLNSTNHNFTELYKGVGDASRKINNVEEDLNGRLNNFIDETSDAAFDKVVNSARLDWDKVVDNHSDLPSDAKAGTTIGVKEDGLVYRYNGSEWVEIYEINLNPISEVDSRLSSRLESTDRRISRNPILPIPIPTYDGSNQTTHPDVLYFEDGWNGSNYWMVHTPYPFNNEALENPSIVSSRDGVYWTAPNGLTNPIDEPTEQELKERAHYSDGVLLMNGNTMECWYRYVNRDKNQELFYRRTSTNGSTWSNKEIVYTMGIDTDDAIMVSPTVIFEEGKYRMWFVGDGMRIKYTESTSGNGGWTKAITVPVNFAKGEESFRAWHIDVSKKDEVYHLTATTHVPASEGNRKRRLFWATSSDGLLFENGKVILNVSEQGFDNDVVYRCSLVPRGNDFLLYYGARNSTNRWGIGLVGGSNVDTMKPMMPYNRNGNLILDRSVIKELETTSLKNGEEILFLTPGVKSVKLLNTDRNTLELQSESGSTTTANFKSHKMTTTQVHPLTDYGVRHYGRAVFSDSEDGETPTYIKLISDTQDGAGIKLDEEPHTIMIVRHSGGGNGHIRVGSVILNGGGLAREGAIRFNESTKKHQGYDGTKWNDLY